MIDKDFILHSNYTYLNKHQYFLLLCNIHTDLTWTYLLWGQKTCIMKTFTRITYNDALCMRPCFGHPWCNRTGHPWSNINEEPTPKSKL